MMNPYAAGGVGWGGRVMPFASGGVIDRPTYFPMAAGGVGLGGEVGSEGLVPLRRLPNGDLGVQTGGGRSGHTITINAPIKVTTGSGGSGKMDDSQVADLHRQLSQTVYTAVKGIVSDEQRPGGTLFQGG